MSYSRFDSAPQKNAVRLPKSTTFITSSSSVGSVKVKKPDSSLRRRPLPTPLEPSNWFIQLTLIANRRSSRQRVLLDGAQVPAFLPIARRWSPAATGAAAVAAPVAAGDQRL